MVVVSILDISRQIECGGCVWVAVGVFLNDSDASMCVFVRDCPWASSWIARRLTAVESSLCSSAQFLSQQRMLLSISRICALWHKEPPSVMPFQVVMFNVLENCFPLADKCYIFICKCYEFKVTSISFRQNRLATEQSKCLSNVRLNWVGAHTGQPTKAQKWKDAHIFTWGMSQLLP